MTKFSIHRTKKKNAIFRKMEPQSYLSNFYITFLIKKLLGWLIT